MSKYSFEKLNDGDIKSGYGQTPWWFKAELAAKSARRILYTGAIPVADVLRDLFCWVAVSLPLFVRIPADVDIMTGVGADGRPYRERQLTDRQAIGRSDTGQVFGVFKSGYTIHQYGEWLIDNVTSLLGVESLDPETLGRDDVADGFYKPSEVGIAAAMLLGDGAQAAVTVEVPQTFHHAGAGLDYRPRILAASSNDGSLASTFKRIVGLPICDNTLDAAVSEHGQTIKVKHSRYSALRIADARETLAVLASTAADFAAMVDSLIGWDVTDADFDALVSDLVPMDDTMSKRSATLATAKRDQVNDLWRFDSRVSPWKGTAFGVLQAWNTFDQHFRPVRGDTSPAERNMLDAITGETGDRDRNVLQRLTLVTGRA